MKEHSGNIRALQADYEGVYGAELEYQRSQTKNSERVAHVYASAKAAKVVASPERKQGARLAGKLKASADPRPQSRAGETIDLAAIMNDMAEIASVIGDAGNASHKARAVAAVEAAIGKHKPSFAGANGRKMVLRTMRKAVRAIVEDRQYELSGAEAGVWIETLLTLEAELGCLQGTTGFDIHVDEVFNVLPFHVAPLGREEMDRRFEALVSRYDELCASEAQAAEAESRAVKRPDLINGAMIGQRHGITVAELKRLIPDGRHYIKAADRDADRKKRGLPVYKRRIKSPDERKQDADRHREVAELMAFYGVQRETVWRWQSKGTYITKLEAMYAEHNDDKLEALKHMLMAHFGVGRSTVRQWVRRKQFAGRVQQYRDDMAASVP